MRTIKKILVSTGIRSEYDILYPIIDKLRSKGRIDVGLILSGAHLSDFHGNILSRIEADGFRIVDKIDTLFLTNRETQRVKGVGMLTHCMSQTVERENPDMLLVVGDREESIATALVGNYMNVLTAHVAGGDPVWGNADDPIRFAVSKLAHIHFPFCNAYANNLIKTGEDSFRIFVSGNPSYENILNTPLLNRNDIAKELGFDIANHKYIIFLKHPLSSEKQEAGEQMRLALSAVKQFCKKNDVRCIGIYPNTDPGAFDIVNEIESIQSNEFIRFFRTIPRNLFINVVRNAEALAGNSSMGILEAPFYKLPVVNIGNRQRGRLQAGNVEFTDYTESSISDALFKACFDDGYRTKVKNLPQIFGDGSASEIILNAVSSIDLDDKKWYVKQNLC